MDCSGVVQVDRAFATIQNPVGYLLGARVSIFPSLVSRLIAFAENGAFVNKGIFCEFVKFISRLPHRFL